MNCAKCKAEARPYGLAVSLVCVSYSNRFDVTLGMDYHLEVTELNRRTLRPGATITADGELLSHAELLERMAKSKLADGRRLKP